MIIDLPALRCPMGCGATLHLMETRSIRCLARKCPEPMAAEKILGERETLDVVTFSDGYFSVLHPLRERVGAALADCPVAAAVARVDGLPQPGDGQFRAWLDEDEELVLKRIEEGT